MAGGCTNGRNLGWVPKMAVFRFIAPVTVVIQVAVAGHVARNVLSGNRIVFFQIALGGPAVKAIGPRSLFNVVLNVVRAVEFGALAGMNFIGFAAGSDFAFAANHGHARGVPIFINVNTKSTGLFNDEGPLRSVHFVNITLTQFADSAV